MQKVVCKSLLLLSALACIPAIASAQTIAVGDLSFDQISPTTDQFDITNAVGGGFAVNNSGGAVTSSTPFNISVSSLTVDLVGGGSIVLPGSDFTSVDSSGDLDCTASACNLFGDDIASATLTGTFSPTSGLSGLDPGYTGIASAYTATVTPSSGGSLVAGVDTATILATETGGVVGTPEPSTWLLLGVGMTGLFLVARKTGYA
jgi:hypothetical protein